MSEEGGRNSNGKVPTWLAELGLKAGEYFTDAKPRWQRAMKSQCFNETARAYAYLSLHTAGFHSEKAVKLEAGELVPCTPTDVASATSVKKQNIRRVMLELKRYGLGDTKGSTKGRVELYLWQRPRPVEAQNGNRANYHFEDLPPTLKPFIPLFKRWKITPPAGILIARDYQDAVAAARDYQNAEMVLKRTLKGNLAPETSNKEERNESDAERNPPDGR